MDSKVGLRSYRDRLSAPDIDRVRELTADVAARFYPGQQGSELGSAAPTA
jgi:hypothetical protein